LSEEELLRLLSNGDPAGFHVLFPIYFPILCRFAEKYLHDVDLAQDIVQETFIKLWKSGGRFASVPELKGFLYTVTRNGCLNQLRGREREEQRYKAVSGETGTPVSPDESDEITRLEYLAAINRVVRQMPQKMQAVFLLSYEDGMSVEQIAKRMNITVKTVRNQKYKSLQLLRGSLDGLGGITLVLLDLLLR
jgi:RNA polymerase sigma-70 factor (ECF subfamily)